MINPHSSPSHRPGFPALVIACLALAAAGSRTSSAEPQQEFLLFGSVDTFNAVGESHDAVEEAFIRPAADVLYSYSGHRFRFLGEYLWSSRESELERLSAGWQVGDNSMLWIGRMHSIAKFWTTEYHHGQFLQTSITRPSVEQWEDESGPMPSHISGIVLERQSSFANHRTVDFGLALGYAPRFIVDRLVPFDLLDPGAHHGLSASMRIAYRPQALSLSQFGVLIGWNDINVDKDSAAQLANLDEVRQLTVSIYGDWSWKRWRFIGNVVYFENDMRYVNAPTDDRFASTYIQGEFDMSDDWTAFGRIETSFNEDQSSFLRMFPSYILHRQMLGMRLDIADFQSLSIELGDSRAQGDDSNHVNFTELRFQWSAVFP